MRPKEVDSEITRQFQNLKNVRNKIFVFVSVLANMTNCVIKSRDIEDKKVEGKIYGLLRKKYLNTDLSLQRKGIYSAYDVSVEANFVGEFFSEELGWEKAYYFGV